MEGQGCLNILVVCRRNGYCAGLVDRGGNVLRTGIGNFSSILIECQVLHHIFVERIFNIGNHSAFGYRFLREKVCRHQSAFLRSATSFDKIDRLCDCIGVISFLNGECRASADIIVATSYIRNGYGSSACIGVILIRNTVLTGKNHICSVLYNHSRFLRRTIVGYGSRDFNGRSGNRLLFNGIDDPCGLIPHRNFSPISAGILRCVFHLLE